MGTIQQKSLWFNIKLSESLIFKPPTRLGIYVLNSEERHFQGQIPPNERPEIIRDLIQYIQREFQITSPISLFGSNGYIYTNSESVNILPQYCTLLVCPAISTKHISTPTLSQQSAPILTCSASAISTELNATKNTAVALIVSDKPVRNAATVKDAGLLNLNSDLDDTISNDTNHEDYEKIPGTAIMRNSVSSATSISFLDWEYLDVQRRLKTFMSEANIEGRQKLKKWFLEFYKRFELESSTSANVRAESLVPCSSVDPNEIELSMVNETILNDLTSQLTQTLAQPAPAPFPPIPNEPTDNSVSEPIIDESRSGSDVEGLSLLYILDSTSIAEEIEVSGSDLEETSLLEDKKTRTFVIDISETTPDTPESGVQGSKCGIVRSSRVKSRNTRRQNVALEIKKSARRQQETHLTSKSKTATAKAKQTWHSCSYPSCNFKTRGQHKLKKHLGNLHFETPFKCGKCGRKYRFRASLSKHSETHKEKKHVCLFKNCSYKSHRSEHLKRHMMTHSGVKPFACKECKYKASNRSQLKDHMRIHTGEKPFACKECDYKASQRSHLNVHKMTHTGEKLFACKQCEFRCCRKDNLKSHVYKRHGVKK